jgi:hypothetical protein
VLFGVGNHSWIIATGKEDIILSGGGTDDVLQNLMNSYISEVGGASGLGTLGTFNELHLEE